MLRQAGFDFEYLQTQIAQHLPHPPPHTSPVRPPASLPPAHTNPNTLCLQKQNLVQNDPIVVPTPLHVRAFNPNFGKSRLGLCPSNFPVLPGRLHPRHGPLQICNSFSIRRCFPQGEILPQPGQHRRHIGRLAPFGALPFAW